MSGGRKYFGHTPYKPGQIVVSDNLMDDDEIKHGFMQQITFLDRYGFNCHYFLDTDTEPTHLYTDIHSSRVCVIKFYGNLLQSKYTHFILACDKFVAIILITSKKSWVTRLFNSVKTKNTYCVNPDYRAFLEKGWAYDFTGFNLENIRSYGPQIRKFYDTIKVDSRYSQFASYQKGLISTSTSIRQMDFITLAFQCVVVHVTIQSSTSKLSREKRVKPEPEHPLKQRHANSSVIGEKERTQCPVCHKTFRCIEHTTIHILVQHMPSKSACPYCDKLRKPSGYIEHIVCEHTDKLIDRVMSDTRDRHVRSYLEGKKFNIDRICFYGYFDTRKMFRENEVYTVDVLADLKHEIMFTRLCSVESSMFIDSIINSRSDIYAGVFRIQDTPTFLMLSSDNGTLIIGLTERISRYGELLKSELRKREIHVSCNDTLDFGITLTKIIPEQEIVSNDAKEFRERYSLNPANIQGKVAKEVDLSSTVLSEVQAMSLAMRSLSLWYTTRVMLPTRGTLSPAETEKVTIEMRLGVQYIMSDVFISPIIDVNERKCDIELSEDDDIDIDEIEEHEDEVNDMFWKKMNAVDKILSSGLDVEKRGDRWMCYLCNVKIFTNCVDYLKHLWTHHRDVYDEYIRTENEL